MNVFSARRSGWLAVLLFLCAPVGAAPWKLTPQEAQKLMPVGEIRAGMKGAGKTVFRGTKIEPFDFTVVGILKNYYMGGDMIFIKMHGGPITRRGANIIAGMSGSPCYIKGRLIGAVSMGDYWAKESFAIVTPIHDMLRAFDARLNTVQPAKLAEVPPQSYRISIDGRPTTLNIEEGFRTRRQPSPPGTLTMRRLATPVMVGGLNERTRRWLEKQWEPLGLAVTDGLAGSGAPGLATAKESAALMQPGAAISCLLMTGDIRAGSTGTLTYRSGSRILAFGHPMVEMGSVSFLLGSAVVHDIFPSIQRSYKQSSIGKLTGTVFQDSSWAIAAELGRLPNLIPVTCTVSDATTGRNRVYRARVVDHPLLTSSLVISAAGEAVYRTHNFVGDATARVRMEINAEGMEPIVRENVYFSPDMIDMMAVDDLGQCLTILSSNPFRPVKVKSVNMSVQLANRHQSATIEKIFLDKDKVEPGDRMQVGVVLKPYGQPPLTKTIDLTLPERIPNGRATLTVRGGGFSSRSAGGLLIITNSGGGPPGIGDAAIAGGPTSTNVSQMIRRFLEKEKNNEIALRLVLPTYSVNIEGEKMADLPASVVQAMRSGKSTGLRLERDEIKWNIPTDWVLSGSQSLQVTIQKKDRSEKKSPRPGAPAPGGPEGMPSSPTPVDFDFSDLDSMAAPLDPGTGPSLDAEPAAAPKPARLKPAPARPAEKAKPGAAPTPAAPVPAAPAVPAPAAPAGKSVVRAPKVWKQTTQADFESNLFQSAGATSENDVRLVPSVSLFANVPEDYIWSVLPDGKGGLYVGTGNRGRIYRVSAEGKAEVLYDSDELEIFALATDRAGSLYAGTAPNGVVLKIAPDGKASVYYKAPAQYVLALNAGSEGDLFVGTGGKGGHIYRVSPDGKGSLWWASPETHILCLGRDAGGNLLAGTGDSGILYRISPEGNASVLYDAAEAALVSLASDKAGNLYAGTAPKGVIYRIAPDGAVTVVYDKAKSPIQAMAADDAGLLYAGGGRDVYLVGGPKRVSALDTPENLQVMAMAVDSSHRVYLGTANNGDIYRAAAPGEGVMESCVHDARLEARWGRLSWDADLPAGTRIEFATRSGSTADPDSSWSPWQPVAAQGSDGPVASPQGRFIQYKATLMADDPAKTPVLNRVSLVYQTRNQPPTVAFTSPAGGEKWSKTQTIRWNGADPDADTLSYQLFTSADAGQSWQPLKSDKAAAASAPVPAPKAEAKAPPAEEEESEDGEDADTEAPAPKAEGSPAPAPPAAAPAKPAAETALKETSFSWDTTQAPDGTYRLKVVATDRLSDPGSPQSAEAVSGDISVRNAAPEVSVDIAREGIPADTKELKGWAAGKGVEIAGVEWRLDEGDWTATTPEDGIFDSPQESFRIALPALAAGERMLEIKAIDGAGNSTTKKEKVKVK
ncbi:MAG: hypothetical protein IT210_02615 [Armatimonadetes bacterium]|nr:hypothetical protein [Armatimonadota bacterium]